MKAEYKPYVEELIELAIKEDIGDGDHTSLCCIPCEERGRMRLLCKQEGIIAGIEVARMVTGRLDPEVKFEQILNDGDRVKVGDVAFYVEGNLQSLLRAERILLNIMQRMSGVATQTAVYADRIADLHTKVLDTRKTTPGMRLTGLIPGEATVTFAYKRVWREDTPIREIICRVRVDEDLNVIILSSEYTEDPDSMFLTEQ